MTNDEMRTLWYQNEFADITSDIHRVWNYVSKCLSADAADMDIEDIKQNLLNNEWATEEELQ